MTTTTVLFNSRIAARKRVGGIFGWLCAAVAAFGVALLGFLLIRILMDGASVLSWRFLTQFEDVLEPMLSGIRPSILGTIWLVVIVAAVSVPIGVGGAIFLEEYGKRNWLARFIEVNIANLAGVPSIVFGILAATAFMRWCGFGRSLLTGALAVSLLILPTVVIASREALRAVPQSIRLASLALGATRWQTIRHHVLPSAIPGIMTGVILALSRAIGEAAPLLIIGGAAYVTFSPRGPFSPFTTLPLQVYNWTLQPDPDYARMAAAAIIVLLGVLLPMNALAIGIRGWRQRRR